jgi:hypothetical protein
MNPWLNNFMRSQAQIIETSVPQEPQKKDHKGRKKSKHGTPDGKHPFGEQDGFDRLCHEKPPKKEVLNYFRQRIAELVAMEEF